MSIERGFVFRSNQLAQSPEILTEIVDGNARASAEASTLRATQMQLAERRQALNESSFLAQQRQNQIDNDFRRSKFDALLKQQEVENLSKEQDQAFAERQLESIEGRAAAQIDVQQQQVAVAAGNLEQRKIAQSLAKTQYETAQAERTQARNDKIRADVNKMNSIGFELPRQDAEARLAQMNKGEPGKYTIFQHPDSNNTDSVFIGLSAQGQKLLGKTTKPGQLTDQSKAFVDGIDSNISSLRKQIGTKESEIRDLTETLAKGNKLTGQPFPEATKQNIIGEISKLENQIKTFRAQINDEQTNRNIVISGIVPNARATVRTDGRWQVSIGGRTFRLPKGVDTSGFSRGQIEDMNNFVGTSPIFDDSGRAIGQERRTGKVTQDQVEAEYALHSSLMFDHRTGQGMRFEEMPNNHRLWYQKYLQNPQDPGNIGVFRTLKSLYYARKQADEPPPEAPEPEADPTLLERVGETFGLGVEAIGGAVKEAFSAIGERDRRIEAEQVAAAQAQAQPGAPAPTPAPAAQPQPEETPSEIANRIRFAAAQQVARLREDVLFIDDPEIRNRFKAELNELRLRIKRESRAQSKISEETIRQLEALTQQIEQVSI